MANRFSGNYPITLAGLLDEINAIANVAITTETTDFDTQAINEKFTRLKSIATKLVTQVNSNQAVNKQAITDLNDSFIAVANDLKGKVDAFSSASGLDIQKVKDFVELVQDIDTESINDLLNGQRSIMSVVNGMSDTAQLSTNVSTVDDGVIVISLDTLGFVENDSYTVVAMGNNPNCHISQDSVTSDHTQVTLKMRDLRYDYIKGFDTTKEAVRLNIALTHNNASAKQHLSNSITVVGDLSDEDTTNDTEEVVIPN
jgi:hypothetical protein